MLVPPVVTEDAAGAAELLTVVLLLVVSAFVNDVCAVSMTSAYAAAIEYLRFFFRTTGSTIEIFLSFYTSIAVRATDLLVNANTAV